MDFVLALQGDCRTLISHVQQADKHLYLLELRIKEKLISCEPEMYNLCMDYQLIAITLRSLLSAARLLCQELLDYHDIIPQPVKFPEIDLLAITERIEYLIGLYQTWQYKIYCSFYDKPALKMYKISYCRYQKAEHILAYDENLKSGDVEKILYAVRIGPEMITLPLPTLQAAFEHKRDLPENCVYSCIQDHLGNYLDASPEMIEMIKRFDVVDSLCSLLSGQQQEEINDN